MAAQPERKWVKRLKLEIEKLSKTYGEVKALQEISVALEDGVYGILGPNGAGKSTLINLITDNVKRESGNILWNGTDSLRLGKEFRRQIGYMPQQQGFYNDMSAKAFLMYMAQVKEIPRKEAKRQTEELLEIVNLKDARNRKVGGFSGGMKQRVLLAQALLGNPKLLILDEPTAGLDPNERIRIRNYIAELSKDRIILFATHVVSDIECIANQVLLLKSGQLVKKGTPAELIAGISGKVGEVCCESFEEIERLQKQYGSGNISQKKSGLMLRLVGDRLPEQARLISEDISLEDVYLYYLVSDGAAAPCRQAETDQRP